MKIKDVVTLLILAVVLIVVGSFLFNVINKNKPRTATIEIVQPIDASFDDSARNMLLGRDEKVKVEDFSSPVDLPPTAGNTSPFRAQ